MSTETDRNSVAVLLDLAYRLNRGGQDPLVIARELQALTLTLAPVEVLVTSLLDEDRKRKAKIAE